MFKLRRTVPVKGYRKPIHNYGGHLHNPPKKCRCPEERRIIGPEGVIWIDLLWCNLVCPEGQLCSRKKQFHKQDKKETQTRMARQKKQRAENELAENAAEA